VPLPAPLWAASGLCCRRGPSPGFWPTYRGGGARAVFQHGAEPMTRKPHLPPAHLPIQTRACRRRVAGQASLHLVTAKSTAVRQPAVEGAATVRRQRWGRSSTARTACSSRGRSGRLNGAAPSRRTSARRSSASPSTVARNYVAFPLLSVPL